MLVGLTIAFLLALSITATALSQEPAQYQVIKVKFKVLDREGGILPGVALSARLDAGSNRLPPDKLLKVGASKDEYIYSVDDATYSLFSNEQTSNADGILEVPFIVFQNRPDQIDYELNAYYGKERTNRIFPKDRKRAFSATDDGAFLSLQIDALPPFTMPRILVAIACWLGATLMGALLFFRGVYKSLLSAGKSIDLSRALCWSGVLLISLIALGCAYWLFLPKIINLYYFFIFLFVIWLLHMLFTVFPKRSS
jgi:hypothetical protein